MARARIYIRRSDDDQSTWSPEAQEREDRRWCGDHGHEVIELYIDDDLSGKREDRPRFQQLLADAKADRGSLVIVHKFDRLARDTETLLRIVYKELLPRQVHVASVTEAIDPYTPLGKMMLTLSGGVSTYHVDNLATEVRKGLREKWELGGWIGPLPLGYESKFDLDGKGERIKGTGRAVFSVDISTVRLIFESYATGNYSDESLRDELNERGLTAVHKGRRVRFQADTVAGILTNPFYIGIVRYKGETRDGVHSAAIDRALWEQCQVIRARRASSLDGTPRCGRIPVRGVGGLLSELAFCARCGWKLHTMMNGEGASRQRYYRCGQRRRFGVCACDAKMIAARPIEEQVFDVLRALTIPPALRDAVIAVVQQRLERPTTLNGVSTEALKAQLTRLKELYEFGDIERTAYLQKREQLQHQLTQTAATTPLSVDLEQAMNLLGNMPQLIEAATERQRRGLLQQVLTNVWVEKGTVVAIRPTANLALLVSMVADMAGGGSSPVEVAPSTCAATASTRST
jgi:DNA invertase Pin-like site-specific DNA recombinase